MKLLIDTNVILDMVLKRNGCAVAMDFFRKAKGAGASAYITASSVTDIFYIIRKEIRDTGQAYIIMENILRLVAVLCVTEKDIQNALSQKWKEFEDCVQYMAARNNRMDYIITVNYKDYADAMLPVMTPAAWIEMMDDR